MRRRATAAGTAATQIRRLGRCDGSAGAAAPQVRRCLFRRESAPTPTSNLVNEHKNPDFVLEIPENEGPEGQKRTKMPILCSKYPKMRVPKAKKAQKPRFCAREVGKLASGSVIAETLSVNVAFLQITAHTSKMQILHNQIINFYQRAR